MMLGSPDDGIVPSSIMIQEVVRFLWTPGSWLVCIERFPILENRLYDTPGGFHPVPARKERGIALEGVSEETLIRIHLVARAMPRD